MPTKLTEPDQIGGDFAGTKIVEAVAVGIEHAPGHAGTERKDRAVRLRLPPFGKTQREHEDVQRLEHPSDLRQVMAAIRAQLGLTRKAVGLDVRTEGIDHPNAAGGRPYVLGREEATKGTVEQLEKLSGGVDIAVARAELAVSVALGHIGRDNRVGAFGDKEMEAAFLQVPRDMLGEAASRRRHLLVTPKREESPRQRIDRLPLASDRAAPISAGRQLAIGMIAHSASNARITASP